MTQTGQKLIELFNDSLCSKRPTTNKRVISDRDSLVLQKSYDFENYHFATHFEVAQDFNLTRERIRQLHNRALRRLGGVGRNTIFDIPCKQLIDCLTSEVNKSKGDNKYEQLINLWLEHIPDISGDIIIKLCSHLLYADKIDIKNNISAFKNWKRNRIAEIKKEQLDLYRLEKQKEKIEKQQEWLINNIIWGKKRKKWGELDTNKLQSKRKINQDSDYITGEFESAKCKRLIQYESELEFNFILMLENMTQVKFFYEQPTTIDYASNGHMFRYTPDFAVFLESGEAFLVEIKDYTGMADARVHRRFSALIEFCDKHGFGFLITDGNNSIDKLCFREYNLDFEREILERLESNGTRRTMFFNEFKELQNKYEEKWINFLSLVIINDLGLYPFPFRLNRKNKHELFRERVIMNYLQHRI